MRLLSRREWLLIQSLSVSVFFMALYPNNVIASLFRVDMVHVVEQVKCTSKQMLNEGLKHIIKKGGEGLMIRQPQSKYENGRSHTLLKIKKFYDAEVKLT